MNIISPSRVISPRLDTIKEEDIEDELVNRSNSAQDIDMNRI